METSRGKWDPRPCFSIVSSQPQACGLGSSRVTPTYELIDHGNNKVATLCKESQCGINAIFVVNWRRMWKMAFYNRLLFLPTMRKEYKFSGLGRSILSPSIQTVVIKVLARNLLEHHQVKAAALYASFLMPLRKCLKFLLSR